MSSLGLHGSYSYEKIKLKCLYGEAQLQQKKYLDSEMNLRKDKNADLSMCSALCIETFTHWK